jgi:hypothetical protein
MTYTPQKKHKAVTEVGKVGGATFTVGAETSNAITINVQVRNQWNRPQNVRTGVEWIIFGDANGDSLATALTGVAAGTDGWCRELVTGLTGIAGTEADGDLDLVLTKSSGAATVYLGIKLSDGTWAISGPATFAA